MLCLHVKRMCSLWYFAMCKVAWEKIIKKASKENSVAWHHFFRTLSGLDTCCLTQCTEFFNQSSMTKCYSNIWDVSTMYVISWCSFFAVIVSNPMKFHLRKKKENMRFGMSMKLRLMLPFRCMSLHFMVSWVCLREHGWNTELQMLLST